MEKRKKEKKTETLLGKALREEIGPFRRGRKVTKTIDALQKRSLVIEKER